MGELYTKKAVPFTLLYNTLTLHPAVIYVTQIETAYIVYLVESQL